MAQDFGLAGGSGFIGVVAGVNKFALGTMPANTKLYIPQFSFSATVNTNAGSYVAIAKAPTATGNAAYYVFIKWFIAASDPYLNHVFAGRGLIVPYDATNPCITLELGGMSGSGNAAYNIAGAFTE